MVCPWFSCPDCARAIIQAGIIKCVGLKQSPMSPRWIEEVKQGLDLLKEAGVELIFLDNVNANIKLRRDGKEIEF